MSGKPLGSTFRAWLLVGVLAAFALLMALGWGFITGMAIDDAEAALDQQLDYFGGMITSEASLAEKLIDRGFEPQEANLIAQDSVVQSVAHYRLWDEGLGVLAADGTVVASNDAAIVGTPFENLINDPVTPTITESLLSSSDRFVGYQMPGKNEVYYAKSQSTTYDVEGQTMEVSILVALPEGEVYFYRQPFVIWLAVASGVLLALVYVLVMILLNRKVVRNIDRANDVLGKITQGDLEQVVDLPEVREFSSLAGGINATVGALKTSIADVQARMDRELTTAKAIQESALPQTFPPFPEIDAFDLYADMKAAREVGGDFYDFFLLDDGRVGIVMADVSGKGIPAALFMMAAKTEIQSCMLAGMGLAEALQTANYQLCQGNDARMFVTVFAAVLDYETGHMEFVNAGHNPPLVRRRGCWEWLREKSGMFVGAYPKVRYKLKETTLEQNDMLLLYTDGVTEAWDPNEELYGESRLEEFLQRHSDLAPRALIGALRRDLAKWANGADQADDITLLALEFGAKPLSTDTLKVPARNAELDRVTAFVNDELARRLCPSTAQNKIDICLEELFVNVASYAYGDQEGNAWITYTYLPDPAGIRVEIADEGEPFDPLSVQDPERPKTTAGMKIGGLGIFMTKAMTDELVYEYRDGRNVTSFVFRWGN